MDFLDNLEALIRAQDPSRSDAAAVLASLGTPSTSVAILDHGKISARCFSVVGDGPETAFQACSISKPVAALAVMKLVQEGKLNLETPITDYLPPSSIELIATPSARKILNCINLKHLMSHTAGLSQHGFGGYSKEVADLESVLSGKPPSNTPQVHSEGLPGHKFSYSGGGISVIQLIMETVTGKPFAEIMQELVLDPLEMKKSFYWSPTEKDNHASAYFTGVTACDVPYHVQPEQAAAGLWTTPTDLLKVVRAMQHSLVTTSDNSGFLPQPLAKLMLTEISSEFALAWMAPKDPGTFFHHNGSNNPGWECILLGYADLPTRKGDDFFDARSQGCGFCIMTNSREGIRAYSKVGAAMVYLKGWIEPRATISWPAATIPFFMRDKEPDSRWSEWQGSWGDHDQWRIEAYDGTPCVRFEDLPAIRLLPAAGPEQRSPAAVDLVLEGLEIMLRLTEEEDGEEGESEKVVQVWHGPTRTIKALKRSRKG